METLLVYTMALAALLVLWRWDRMATATALSVSGSAFMASYWLTLKPYDSIVHDVSTLRVFPGVWTAWAGFLMLLAAFWITRKDAFRGDLSALQARIGLAFLLVVGALFRLWRFREAHPTWGYDPFWEIIEVRNVVESGLHPLMFDLGNREPLFTYILAPLWWLFPEASPYVVANIGSTLIDLTSVWVLYLIGREMGGRRAGLFAAALGAASKPMAIMTLACTRGVTVTLGAALVVLFSLRIFRRSDLKHFLQWGAALGLALYTYTGIRILVLWALLSVLGYAFVLSRRPSDASRSASSAGPWPFLLAAAGGLFFTQDFLRTNRFMFLQVPGVDVTAGKWVLVLLFAAALTAWLVLRCRKDAGSTPLRHWFLGAGLFELSVFPLVNHPLFARNVEANSFFRDRSFQEALQAILAYARQAWAALFLGGGPERPDMNILGDSFLDILSIPAVLLGLAFLLARPSRRSVWLVLASLAAILPYIIGRDSHSVRLLSALPVLFALAVPALVRLWTVFRSLWPGRTAGWAGLLLLTVTGLTAVQALDGRIWGAFATQEDCDGALARRVRREPPDRRVYLYPGADFFLAHQQVVQLDGRTAYMMKRSNPIDLAPGEPVPTVVVYLYKNEEYSDERLGRASLLRAYPSLRWDDVRPIGFKHTWRVEIKPDMIREDPSEPFYVRRVGGPVWKREFIGWDYGLARGSLINQEDRVRNPCTPPPPDLNSRSVRLTGPLVVPQEGKVKFAVDTPDLLRLLVDGRTVLDHRPSREGPESSRKAWGSLRLKAGLHHVEMRVDMRVEGIPDIQVQFPGEERPNSLCGN